MSKQTRKSLSLLFAVAVTLIPANIAMVALLWSTGNNVPEMWANGMSSEKRVAVANEIEAYPVEYRRAVMKLLRPAERAAAWRGVVDRYTQQHPRLTASQRKVLSDYRELLTPALFSGRLLKGEAALPLKAIETALVAAIGNTDAKMLANDMGPAGSMTALPWRTRVVAWLKRREEALAEDDCNCSQQSDWCAGYAVCSGAVECKIQANYPACGSFWVYVCDGMCAAS